eukprot:EG_transcript_4715
MIYRGSAITMLWMEPDFEYLEDDDKDLDDDCCEGWRHWRRKGGKGSLPLNRSYGSSYPSQWRGKPGQRKNLWNQRSWTWRSLHLASQSPGQNNDPWWVPKLSSFLIKNAPYSA